MGRLGYSGATRSFPGWDALLLADPAFTRPLIQTLLEFALRSEMGPPEKVLAWGVTQGVRRLQTKAGTLEFQSPIYPNGRFPALAFTDLYTQNEDRFLAGCAEIYLNPPGESGEHLLSLISLELFSEADVKAFNHQLLTRIHSFRDRPIDEGPVLVLDVSPVPDGNRVLSATLLQWGGQTQLLSAQRAGSSIASADWLGLLQDALGGLSGNPELVLGPSGVNLEGVRPAILSGVARLHGPVEKLPGGPSVFPGREDSACWTQLVRALVGLETATGAAVDSWSKQWSHSYPDLVSWVENASKRPVAPQVPVSPKEARPETRSRRTLRSSSTLRQIRRTVFGGRRAGTFRKLLPVSFMLLTILAAGTLLVFNWMGSPRSASEFYQSGTEFLQAREYSKAVIQFRNALAVEPNHPLVLRDMAQSLIELRDFSGAVAVLDKLVTQHPNDIESKLLLGQLYLLAGSGDSRHFAEANRIADEILADQPSHLEALLLSGNAAAGLQEYERSIGQFEEAMELDPENIWAALNLGAAYAQQKHHPEAEKAFLRAVEISPKDKKALLSLIHYYTSTGQSEQVEKWLDRILALYPTEPDVYLTAVRFYHRWERYGDIETLLRSVQDKSDRPDPSVFLAASFASQGRKQEAIQELKAVRFAFPGDSGVAKKLASLLIPVNIPDAQREVDWVLERNPEDWEARLLGGQLLLLKGALEKAKLAFSELAKERGDAPQPFFYLGIVSAQQGRPLLARENFERALSLNPRYFSARLGLADLLLSQRSFADSRLQVERALELAPGQFEARLLSARLNQFEGRLEECAATLTELEQRRPEDPRVQAAWGHYEKESGRLELSLARFEEALKLQPDFEEALRGLVAVHVEAGQPELAMERVKRIALVEPRAFHYTLMGETLLTLGQPLEAEEAFKKAVAVENNRETCRRLVRHFAETNQIEKGLEVLDDLLLRYPEFADGHAAQGSLYYLKEDLSKAKESYRKALSLDVSLADAANNLAYLLSDEESFLEALDWAQSAVELDPKNPHYRDTLGWVHYQMNSYVLAANHLRTAHEAGGGNYSIQYHLALALWKTGHQEEARRLLLEVVESSEPFAERLEARRQLSQFEKILGDKSLSPHAQRSEP